MPFTLKTARRLAGGAALGLFLAVGSTAAQQTPAADARAEMLATFGGIPTFIELMPEAAVAAAWALTRDVELATTALDAKTKALIGLAVAAQIPCTYCIWADTEAARAAGATEEEIGEALAMAGLTRFWSTIFNGLQLDFATFQRELGGGP